jgi:hypothetical protein
MLWSVVNRCYPESGELLINADSPREAIVKLLKITRDGRGIVNTQGTIQGSGDGTIVTVQNGWQLIVKPSNLSS